MENRTSRSFISSLQYSTHRLVAMFITKYYVLLLYFIYYRQTLAVIHTEIDKLYDEYTKIENCIFEDTREKDKSIIDMFYEFSRQRILPLSKKWTYQNFTPGIQENIDGIDREYMHFLESIGYFYKSNVNFTNDTIALLTNMISNSTVAAKKRMDIMNIVIYKDLKPRDIAENANSWCNADAISAQQLYFNIHDAIAIAQFKSYLMSRFKNILNGHFEGMIMPLVKVKRQLKKLFDATSLDNIQRNGAPRVVRVVTHSEIDRLDEGYRKIEKRMLENLMEKNKTVLLNIFHKFDSQKLQKVSKAVLDRNVFKNLTTAKGIQNNIDIIENSYNVFKKYIDKTLNNQIVASQLKDITIKVTKISGRNVDKMYGELDKIGEELLEILQSSNTSEHFTSTQQSLFDIHDTIALAQFKCYLMARFKHFFNDHYEDNLIPLVKLKRQIRMIFDGTDLKTHIRRCDPVRFVQNQNYIQFTRVMQGFIPGFDEFPENCQGKTSVCMHIYPSGRVCTSSFPHRKYDYIEADNGERLGKLQYCRQSSIKRIPRQNNQSICLCDQQGRPSDRYISLRSVFSNVSSNSVITGVKFIKLSRILHLQVQEGKLLPEGHIDQKTVRWIPIETFNITDLGVNPDKDYFLLTNKSRTIVMGEIQAEEENNDYVLTGVGFRYINKKIQLNIQSTQFNWETGQLNITENKNLRNNEPIRTSFIPSDADIPTYTNETSQLWNAEPLGPWAISFVNTDFKKDAAQTTVPFLDAQEVISVPATPLIGAGLYYKGSPGYGGFIAPVIKQYDFLKMEDIMSGLN